MTGFLGRLATLVVKMLTTEGIARLAASRYEPGAGTPFAGPCSTMTVDEAMRTLCAPSNAAVLAWGLKAVTRNQSAKTTVTVCANNRQKRCVKGSKNDKLQPVFR